MARDSKDREDLLRDATAFTSRIQFIIPQEPQHIVVFAGFRKAGAVSFYFDQDPVYHFNGQGQLRRAFIDNTIIKAEAGQLIGWTRQQQTDTEVVMLRDDLSTNKQQACCEAALKQLHQLQKTLATGNYQIEGQVQPDNCEDVLKRVVAFLANLNSIKIADSPRVGG